jgi:hypothetical protein
VGVDKKFAETRQDIYENPRTVVDLQVSKNIGKLNLKLTLGDILRQDQIFYQDNNADGKFSGAGANGDLLMFKFNNGFTTSITAGYTF